jgi:serine phosphatase RsbU (regulator of sigma subunit)/uncharacterized glyoxalase superfamily protein PhnB
MGTKPSPHATDRYSLRLDGKDPYLALHHFPLFVRDQDVSVRFYVEKLGFEVLIDACLPGGDRFVAVAPPDGPVFIGLVTPRRGQPQHELIETPQRIVLITEDVHGKYKEWSERGVEFHHAPTAPPWGGTFTTFADPDGNVIALMGFDEVSLEIDERRRIAAEKLERERRAEQELEFARQVQARLFPQFLPPLETLDYAGTCVQAKQVGGDYYDFLNLGGNRLGLVIGDISGKGMAAALLMANLQANLRGQCAVAIDEPENLLRSVNELFYQNTNDSAYATLFFGEYDDRAQRLRYANCGHLSALLVRHDGRLEQLDATCTVLGLFPGWTCTIAECQLSRGDTLALYTDGISESFDHAEQEYGQERIVTALQRHRELSAERTLAAILDDVKRFSPKEQHDDITLLVAKCTGRAD